MFYIEVIKLKCSGCKIQSNVDNLNNVRGEASRQFRNNCKEYLETKIGELATNSKIKNIRVLLDFQKGYQPRRNIVDNKKVIWLQTVRVFWLVEGTLSLSC
jgi:hypothetical protein